jgi:predicted nucleic acid-binding protein
MTQSILADTGPLYAAADPDDEHHARAQSELKRLARAKREIVLAYPTLLEGYTLVLCRLGVRVGYRWLSEMQQGCTLINPAPEDYRQAAAKLAQLPGQPITLFDATVAVLAARLRMEVWTYDHHFDLMQTSVWR